MVIEPSTLPSWSSQKPRSEPIGHAIDELMFHFSGLGYVRHESKHEEHKLMVRFPVNQHMKICILNNCTKLV